MTKLRAPQNVKQLRSFLGLVDYYRKFVQNYSLISKPLTNLLKKGKFLWIKEATEAFEHLKVALSYAPVLALPDFFNHFEIETDASNGGIGVVQEGNLVAFLSNFLGPKWKRLTMYEKKLLTVVTTVQKWEQYLSISKFIIRTDQESLKWLLQ